MKELNVGILGAGEVGKAVASFYHKPFIRDLERDDFAGLTGLDLLHVCIPHDSAEKFKAAVTDAMATTRPELTIIHSTVPVGTTEALGQATGRLIVHSPVRGVHPKLKQGLKTFVKYIGADDPVAGEYAATHLEQIGMKPMVLYKSRTTELLKLLDTTYYGVAIAFHAYAEKLCNRERVNFDMVMTHANESYNAGYKRLKKGNVTRPVLYPPSYGKIGGHCVIPNAKLLVEQYGKDLLLSAVLRHR